MPLNIKKLVTYFLGGAAVIAFAVFLALPSAFPDGTVSVPQNTPPQTAALAAPSSSFSLESLLHPAASLEEGTKTNLTQNFAKNLASAIIDANASGPTSTKTSQALILPKESAVAGALAESISTFDPSSLGIATSVPDEDIAINSDQSLNAASAYFASANDIVAKTIGSTDFSNLARRTQDPQTVILESQTISEAADELKKLPVPDKLAAYHKRLILALVNLGEIGSALANPSSDPLKTTALVQGGTAIMDFDAKAVEDEYKKINWNGFAMTRPWRFEDLFGFLAPSEAHAQAYVPVRDFEAEQLLQEILNKDTLILETLNDTFKLLLTEWQDIIATQDEKYFFVQVLQQEVESWILNNQNPRFIQNWQDYLSGASTYQAAITLEDLASANALDPEIQNNALYFAQRSYLLGGAVPKATLDATIVDNLPSCSDVSGATCPTFDPAHPQQSFYDNFNVGGFASYIDLLRPQNNIFGADQIYSDLVAQNAGLAAQAANSEGIANQGFLSEKVCIDQTKQGDCRTWAITLPGIKVADALDAALNASIEEIVNMQFLPNCIRSMWDDSLLRNIMTQNPSENGILGSDGSGFTIPVACHYSQYNGPIPAGVSGSAGGIPAGGGG